MFIITVTRKIQFVVSMGGQSAEDAQGLNYLQESQRVVMEAVPAAVPGERILKYAWTFIDYFVLFSEDAKIAAMNVETEDILHVIAVAVVDVAGKLSPLLIIFPGQIENQKR